MIQLEILYEDDNLIVVNKPAGVLVTPDRWDHGIPTLQDMLREYLRRNQGTQHPNLRVIHRLDKDTSGVIVLAKNVKAQSNLSKQFETGEVSKTYYAIVKGQIPQSEGIINYSLSEASHPPGTMTVNPKGKKSITLFNVLERFDGFSLVEAKPLTGRTHQVRVHLKAFGFPLAIDPLYSDAGPVYLSQFKKNYKSKDEEEKPVINRLPLHAFRLSFREPTEGKTIVVEAPLPKDFSRMLKMLRKYRIEPIAVAPKE
jgi:23S rRNA pseudouridine955/2504/2580 synthase/23S rRNA pseudouridine1911/1915/1917 synthase